MSRVNAVVGASLITVMCGVLAAQAPPTPPRQPAPSPWRFAGTQPCVGPEGGVLQCPPAAKTIAVPSRPPVRQRHWSDADQAGRARHGRADYRGGCGRAGLKSRQPGHGGARHIGPSRHHPAVRLHDGRRRPRSSPAGPPGPRVPGRGGPRAQCPAPADARLQAGVLRQRAERSPRPIVVSTRRAADPARRAAT